MTRRTIADFRRATARRLRTNATDIEKILWQHLRHMEIEGSHFRRQVPIGPYVADFACMAARLVIEVDGSQHGEAHAQARDAERTQWLEREGYRVVRFWNNEVVRDRTAVMEAIYVVLYGSLQAEPSSLKHLRWVGSIEETDHPTPAR